MSETLSSNLTGEGGWSVGRPLDVQDAVSAGRHILVLSGELDIASADQLEAMVRQICDTATTEVVLDLSKLRFIDSSGLRAVLAAGEVCEEHGHEFVLVPGPRNIQRVFELTRLAERLPFRESGSQGA
jgi:anti-sigma B factor antagonist